MALCLGAILLLPSLAYLFYVFKLRERGERDELEPSEEKENSPRAEQRTPPTPPSRRRLRWFRFTLPVLPLVLLGVLEICLRLGGYGYNPQFFKRLNIGGEDFFVQNEEISVAGFSREIARNPVPIRFVFTKRPARFAFLSWASRRRWAIRRRVSRRRVILKCCCGKSTSGRKFEVINVAFTAINSHVILPIARECAAHEGDCGLSTWAITKWWGRLERRRFSEARRRRLRMCARLSATAAAHGQLLWTWGAGLKGKAQAARWGGNGDVFRQSDCSDSPRRKPCTVFPKKSA